MQLNQDTLDMRKKERYAKVVNTLHESALVPAESDPSAGCQTLVATGG